MRGGEVGKVGRDVGAGDFDFSVLHVLGVHEQNVVDYSHFFEKYGADEAVEVAARHQSKVFIAHMRVSGHVGFGIKVFSANAADT